MNATPDTPQRQTARPLLMAIGASGKANLAELQQQLGFTDNQLRGAVDRLRKHRLITAEDGAATLTDLGRKTQLDANKLRSGPQGAQPGSREWGRQTARDRMWAALRASRRSSIPELMQLAGLGEERDIESNVTKFLNALLRAGYVGQMNLRQADSPITSNGVIRWYLSKDTGPKTPIWRPSKEQLYDRNLEQAVPCPAPRSETPRRAHKGNPSNRNQGAKHA